jgi:uncharacterized repeat protein (TIGR01451 family)
MHDVTVCYKFLSHPPMPRVTPTSNPPGGARAGLLARLCLALWLGLAGLVASAQTCALPGWDGPATPSGVVNSYHGGSGSPAAGATSITVASISGQRTNTRSLRAGDLILVIQMQDSATGTNAGLYEYAMVTAVSGTTLSLSRGLANTYNQAMSTSSVRNWQVVWVPQYASATVSGTVSSDRWSINTTTGAGTGGIVALDVAGSLALSGTVTAAGAGFRGAFGLNGTSGYAAGTATTANFNYTVTAVYGGQKGEGIQGTPPNVFDSGSATPLSYATLLGQGYALGAGGQASIGNAGGGGNDGLPSTGGNQYNSGGGGGANAGAGGQGGNSWNGGDGSNAALNQGTNTNIGNVAGGKGGGAQTNSAARLMLGGGGGAGSSNNNSNANAVTSWPPTANTTALANGADGPMTVGGASGGGIVMLRAGSLSGSGSVVADGYNAYNTSGGSEGSGGGGAGGSVFVSAGSNSSALAISARGGAGGYSNYFNHGPGGGGGGGYIMTNFAPGSTSVSGGANGLDACCGGTAGNGSPKAWNSATGSAGTVVTTAGTPSGLQGGSACLPVLSVTKSTTTPTITAATGAAASYAINVSNSGGAASNVFVFDANLPPGWTYTTTPATTYAYSPVPPGAASAGAESTSAVLPAGLPVSSATSANSAAAVSLRASGAAPGTVPSTGSNSMTFGSFYLPQNGSLTITYAVSIPDTATAGTYHNPAGVIFLDPTRTSAGATRMVSPATNVSANRAGIGYSANTTYQSGATTNVAGSSYSGLQAGPATEDVTLLPDLSVTKTATSATFTIGAGGQQYLITARNNGRPVADQVYASTQASGQSATAIVSPTLSVTDTLPAGMTLGAVTSSNTGLWTCTPNATSTTFSCSAGSGVYPLAAATTLVTITATVAVSATACPGPLTNAATFTLPALGDANTANNTGTTQTFVGCATSLTVAKTDGVAAVAAGGTTSYTVTFANLGPASADGATVSDTPGTGLSCSVASCAAADGAACPATGVLQNLLSGGVALPSFPGGSNAVFLVSCGITATGQ